MLGRPVSPSDCALALAIPMSRAEFVADSGEAAPKDLAKSLGKGLQPEWAFANRYEPLLGLVLDLVAEMQQRGVSVYHRTTLQDIPAILKAHRVVTLVAHWRFTKLAAGDILDWPGFRSELARSRASMDADESSLDEDPIARQLLYVPTVTEANGPADLADALNSLLEPALAHYHWLSSRERSADPAAMPVAGLTRVHLEERFPRCIAPGKCLELADRLCTVWEFIEQIPCDFDGILDLTVCHSLIHAEAIRRARSPCNALCNRGRAKAHVRLLIYRRAILSLSDRAEPYEDVMSRIHISLLEEIRRRQNAQT